MDDRVGVNFRRIAEAIGYINANFRNQPSLDDMAGAAGISPYHFQRVFTEWAGVSPKKFLQYLSLDYAKRILEVEQSSVLDAAFETGLSGSSRLHDLFVTIEGMTPGEFRNGGENLRINYRFANSPFGKIIVASTAKGVCHMSFGEDESKALADLRFGFPNARIRRIDDDSQRAALSIFRKDWECLKSVRLHLKGTAFQLKVWEALLTIPMGDLSTYGDVAGKIGKPGASRAVGTAIGGNPVAFLIPCHRVIRSGGSLGHYRWGSTRKSAIIGWEASRTRGQLADGGPRPQSGGRSVDGG